MSEPEMNIIKAESLMDTYQQLPEGSQEKLSVEYAAAKFFTNMLNDRFISRIHPHDLPFAINAMRSMLQILSCTHVHEYDQALRLIPEEALLDAKNMLEDFCENDAGTLS